MEPKQDKLAALQALRGALGSQVVSGTELLQEQELRDNHFSTDWQPLDEVLGGGLPTGQLTEVLSSGRSRGSGLVMAQLIARARKEGSYVMLLDVGKGFTPWSFPARDLEVLLWVGCDSVELAVKALDVATRDENFSLFLMDLRDCDAADLRSVRPKQWYRIVGQMRMRDAASVLFSSAPVTSVSKRRVEMVNPLSLETLHQERSRVLKSCCIQEAAAPVSREPSNREPMVALKAG